MDLLYSPYGVGTMPKPTKAETARRTEDLRKPNSFQRMLELEKEKKAQRLRAAPPRFPTASQPIVQLKEGPGSRPDRLYSAFPQESHLMLDTTQRVVVPPLISITNPQPANDENLVRSSGGEAGKGSEPADAKTPTNSESLQTQVKSPAAGDDGDDAMSEQSSICQSPSWEGYGQRKREKKLEAERRKREKEKAEKEAKAAKKRNTGRLSKPPPPSVTTKHGSRATILTNADRAMSDPLLITQHPIHDNPSIHQPEDIGRSASADDLHQSRRLRAVVAKIVPVSSPGEAIPMTMSEGPTPTDAQPTPECASTSEPRSPRDAFPPSASRTPMLRHMSPSGNNRGDSLLQGAANVNRSPESPSGAANVTGAGRDGYVLYQRTQAADRALAGLADEQLAGGVDPSCPPKSSPARTQHTRRLSLTQEAKFAAMRLLGMRATPPARDDGLGGNESDSQSDCLAFKAIPYAHTNAEPATSTGTVPASPESGSCNHRTAVHERPSTSESAVPHRRNAVQEGVATLERPLTSQSSASSSGPSIAHSAFSKHNKKSRSLKDAAKAALQMSHRLQKPKDNSMPSELMPPYFALRSRMQPRASVRAMSDTSRVPAEDSPAPTPVPLLPAHAVISLETHSTNMFQQTTATTSVSDSSKHGEIGAQETCRASEGSSSSSAYEDTSPRPSPTTTPGTSRPQSAKDFPLTETELTKGDFDSSGLQDDERTLRQSRDSSKSSTPRIVDSEVRESGDIGGDIPVDIDCDAQSFNTSIYYSDDNNNNDSLASPTLSSTRHGMGQSSATALTATPSDVQQPRLPKLSFDLDFGRGIADDPIFIPPRSKKRDLATVDRSRGDLAANEQLEAKMKAAPIGMGAVGGDEQNRESGSSPNGSKDADENETRGANLGRNKRTHHQQRRMLREVEKGVKPAQGREEEVQQTGVTLTTMPEVASGGLHRGWSSKSTSSASSTVPSISSRSPAGTSPASEFQIPGNPYLAEFIEPLKGHGVPAEIPKPPAAPSPTCLPRPLQQVASKHPSRPRTHAASTGVSEPTTASGPSTPFRRPSGTAPASILKQPENPAFDPPPAGSPPVSSRPHILSSLPKHMQLQAGISVRGPGVVAEARPAPIAKMFVECCSCRFYHDMPSKIYECMARPDAVVEDRVLGISGAITTMVKCPWCQHNMSRNCCAGYAAVVYLTERLH
ncbi:hypothetical protein BT67DRAFT_85282 [Trichocladium antarcticum]|uniref:Uncharacterized protein n=1 Tax=Trichocladium antarcticum TaxID=1450529 RepID=A0AAN6UGP2_9PEZI|nr:hypothetical protein BT67DRAFT_85282 [Trichocladium antarcticum]